MRSITVSLSQTVISGSMWSATTVYLSAVVNISLTWAVMVPFFSWRDGGAKTGRYFRGTWSYDPFDETIRLREANPWTGEDSHDVLILNGVTSDWWNVDFPLKSGMTGTGKYRTWWGVFQKLPPLSWTAL